MTTLTADESAIGLVTKVAIVHPTYNILYACHCDRALNLLRLFGCGCFAILGPDEIDQIPHFIHPDESDIDELVIPPFFIDDDESALKAPNHTSRFVHITFLGVQSLMSCANALLNIKASPHISVSCIGPRNAWAREHLESSVRENTLWNVTQHPNLIRGGVTFCSDLNTLASLEPTDKQIIVCHGLLSEEELQYIDSIPKSPRVFQATQEGYVEKTAHSLDTLLRPQKLWDTILSTLYED